MKIARVSIIKLEPVAVIAYSVLGGALFVEQTPHYHWTLNHSLLKPLGLMVKSTHQSLHEKRIAHLLQVSFFSTALSFVMGFN